MPETLVIRLPQDDTTAAEWTVIDDAGTLIGQVARGELHEAAAQQEQRRVLVLAPGTQTVTTRARLPVKSANKMLQVVPYALEDQLAGDVTRMHFALGERDEAGEVAVVAADRERVGDWVGRLDAAGIGATRLLSDVAGVPATDGGFTVLLDDAEACVRDADGGACFVDHASLPDTLTLMIGDRGQAGDDEDGAQPLAPLTVYFQPHDDGRLEAILAEIAGRFGHAEFRRLPGGILPRLAAEALDSNAPNLLQGEFAARRKFDKLWRPWRTAATLAAALLIVSVAVKAAELVTYKKRHEALRAEMRELYAKALPDATDLRDPAGDLRRRLSAGPGNSGESAFLDALGTLARSLPDADTTFVKSINFANGQMNLEIVSPDVPTLDVLRRKVSEGSGWQATLTQTSPRDGAVEGRVQMQRSGT